MSFEALNLHKTLLNAVLQQGYVTPSPVQEQAIPAVLTGQDVMAAAQTGTGKTAAFGLPVVQLLAQGTKARSTSIRALILTPTRELAAQVCEHISVYSAPMNLNTDVVFGGVNIRPQISRLRRGVDILVATPGRLLDLYHQKAVDFSQIEVFILDEADRMLDMGFIPDIKKIIRNLPEKRQNLMFSATFSGDIRKLAESFLSTPIKIDVSPRNSTADTVKQWIHPVDKRRKAELLAHLIWENIWDPVLIFCRTKHGANKLAKKLELEKIPTMAIHGNKTQGARNRALQSFKDGKIRALVATDIAARGIDIEQLPQVVNYDLPDVPEDYVHRIGRTGRAGATGQAISLVSLDEKKQLRDIERLIKQPLESIVIKGFEPTETDADVAEAKAQALKRKQEAQAGRQRNKQRRGARNRSSHPAKKDTRSFKSTKAPQGSKKRPKNTHK